MVTAARTQIRLRVRLTRRVAPMLLYAVCSLTTWGLIGVGSHLRVAEVGSALVLQAIVGVLIALSDRDEAPAWSAWLAIGGFLASVALLRDGVRPAPGYAPLLLLPVIWAAVRSSRREMLSAVAGVAVVMFTPIVVIGGAQYPSSQWRQGSLLIVISAAIGIWVLALVERLRASEEHYRLLAENSTDLVLRFAVDGTITYASAASHALLGYAPAALVGRPIAELTLPAQTAGRPVRAARVDAALGTTVVESQLRHKDGRWLWFEATVRAIRDADGVVLERQASARLVEERKQLQLTVERQRDEASDMLASQHALGQIATLVATGAQPGAVFHEVAEQVASLISATLGGVVRFDAQSGVGEIVGGWSADGTDITGGRVDLTGTTAAAMVHQTGAVVRFASRDGDRPEDIHDRFGIAGALCAPIRVNGELWGSVGAAFGADTVIGGGAEERLIRFAELVAVAIANAQAWETLAHQAATDPITGLANHRTFHERLQSEFEQASRYGRALSVVLFDLDHFKQINDTHGHRTGDEVLVAVAQRLAGAARRGDLVARIGGEEFAWLMPETTQDVAYLAAERARDVIAGTPFAKVGSLTVSAGVCSNEQTDTPHELFNTADQALYSAKHSGRNTTSVHSEDPAASMAAL